MGHRIVAIPWTLHRYIMREMGKTFFLTAIALTALLSLGGGVLNMIELGEVTPSQFARLMGLVFPVAAALTLPISALFSAAVTYGRLSADNEFVACRSGGINIHRLLLPSVYLSLLSGAVTFVLVNFLIPGTMRNLSEFLGRDVATLIQQRLRRPQGISLGDKYRVYADDTVLRAESRNQLTLERVAFVETDGGEWVRHGTAARVDLNFEHHEERVRLSGKMTGLSYYDRKSNGFDEAEELMIGANDLPLTLPRKIKFLNLFELEGLRRDPMSWQEVRDAVDRVRVAFARRRMHDALWNAWESDGEFRVEDSDLSYRIRPISASRIPRDGGVDCAGPVSIEEQRRGRTHSLVADRVVMEAVRGSDGRRPSECGVAVEAWNARASDSRTPSDRGRETLGLVTLPAQLIEEIEGLTSERVLMSDENGAPDDPLSLRRIDAANIRNETTRKVRATLHERAAFSASALVLVILGAALGIVFRGAHLLTAFGISFIPSLIVMVAILAGKQMSQNEPTHVAGLAVIWSGLALAAVGDAFTLLRWVRR